MVEGSRLHGSLLEEAMLKWGGAKQKKQYKQTQEQQNMWPTP